MILVVDDEPDIAEELADLISSTGRSVRAACHALEALELAKEIDPQLVITDMRMPDMDGAELVRRIAAIEGNDARFIIVSGHLAAEEELAMLHDVAYSLFQKPIDVERLLEQIALYDNPIANGT